MARAPRFWQRRGPTALALWPASRIWGSRVARRMARSPSFLAPVPVICVGNYTTGGEGKTPTAIALARLAVEEGLRPGFLSRGHGGVERGPVIVVERDTAWRVGDEPLLLARVAPTVVSRDRPSGARLLIEKTGVDLIIMDDGFQNPSLGKDLVFVAADAESGFGNGLVLPAGPLRAPLAVQLQRTDALVLIGEGAAAPGLARLAARGNLDLFRAHLEPASREGWAARPVLAFAGIGHPQKFFAGLEQVGAKFAGRIPFPDHHAFTADEAEMLLQRARSGALRLVTTEKDLARLYGASGKLGELAAASEPFKVRLVFDRPEAVRAMIRAAVERVRTNRRRALAVAQ
ncbi:MAG: tetraacyldisaccharide 4'-kinase [Bauldia sp.]|nr:tetraacyldisaccharide 4'-kinase [Bauldia sp.]